MYEDSSSYDGESSCYDGSMMNEQEVGRLVVDLIQFRQECVVNDPEREKLLIAMEEFLIAYRQKLIGEAQ